MNLVNDIPITQDGFNHVNCIIEIPKGTNTKYEYNEKYNIFELERSPCNLFLHYLQNRELLKPYILQDYPCLWGRD